MAGRRHIYNTGWYKSRERAFTDALGVRFDMILSGEAVLPVAEFVSLVFAKYPQFWAGPIDITAAIDRRAIQCRSL
jgi:hypothetical protein